MWGLGRLASRAPRIGWSAGTITGRIPPHASAFHAPTAFSAPPRSLYSSNMTPAQSVSAFTSFYPQPATRRPEALVINIFCKARYGLLHDICRVLLRLGFNLRNSSWLAAEGYLTIMLTISKENGLGKADAMCVRTALMNCETDNEFFCKVLPSSPFPGMRVCTVAEVVGLDRPGIVANVSAVLDDHNVDILALDTLVEQTRDGSHPMFRSTMTLCLNEKISDEFAFKSREAEQTELERVVYDIEKHLDHDIQLEILDTD